MRRHTILLLRLRADRIGTPPDILHLPRAPHAVHTAAMTLKNAAFLALIGTLLLTVVLAVDFINTLSGVLRDLIPAMMLLRSLIYLFAGLMVLVFFFAFHRSQSR